MDADAVVELAQQVFDVLDPEPPEEFFDACGRWNCEAGRWKTDDELAAEEPQRRVVEEWRTLTDNAAVFLCEAVAWDVAVLRAAEDLAPEPRKDPDWVGFDSWSLIDGAAYTAWHATCDPFELEDGRNESVARRIARSFVQLSYLFPGPPRPEAFRPCDREAALSIFDDVHRELPMSFLTGELVTDEELEAARLALIMWEPSGRDERARPDQDRSGSTRR